MSKESKNKRSKILLFITILAVAWLLFTYKLDQIPAGLYADEAVAGYNAYSILKTGKDEYGKSFPILFRFFGSYSPPLFVYFLVPLIKIFGLKIWVIRSLSVMSMILVAVLVFLFLKSLKRSSLWLPYLGMFLFVISPWAIFFSRVGYEVTLAFAIFSLGVYLLWLGLKRPKLIATGLLTLSLSAYTAHTEIYLVLLFVFSALIIFRNQLFSKKAKKWTLLGLTLAAAIQIPQILLIKTPAFWNKESLFYSKAISNYAKNHLHFLPQVLAIPLAFIREFSSQWLTYFSPRSLFFLPDPDPQRSIPELSVFYDWMLAPYLVGLWLLWNNRKKDWGKYLLLLLVLSPVPAALVGDPFSTQRALPLLFPLVLVIALGTDKLFSFLKYGWQRIILVFIILTYSFLWLWRGYFVFFPKERAVHWGYGFGQLAKIIKNNPNKKYIIDQGRMKPAYIQLAFFWQYPPARLQKAVDLKIATNYYWQTDFDDQYTFANVEIRPIYWKGDIYKEQILVGDELAISEDQAEEHFLKKVFEIKDPLNNLLFQGYATDPTTKCLSIPTNPRCQR